MNLYYIQSCTVRLKKKKKQFVSKLCLRAKNLVFLIFPYSIFYKSRKFTYFY